MHVFAALWPELLNLSFSQSLDVKVGYIWYTPITVVYCQYNFVVYCKVLKALTKFNKRAKSREYGKISLYKAEHKAYFA